MTKDECLAAAQVDMREKVAWARRELAAMQALESSGTIHGEGALLFQDRFLSFLHAGRLHWFYLGVLCDDWEISGARGQLLDAWIDTRGQDARHVLDTLAELRDVDVHTAPVEIALTPTADLGIVRVGGRLARVNGAIARVRIIRFCASHDGQQIQCIPFASTCLSLLEQMADDLPRIMQPARDTAFVVVPQKRPKSVKVPRRCR